MNTTLKKSLPTVVLLACAQSSFAIEDGIYTALSIGSVSQSDSQNAGNFTTDFTTGSVTGVMPPLTLPSGSALGWNTEFESGDAFNIAIGLKTGATRWEFEYASSDSDVKTHTGVEAGGLALGAIDAGVLISGNTGDLGASVAGLVADGQGTIETAGVFVNYFYDFENNSAFTPFIGGGIGYAYTDVIYRPSGLSIIDDSDDDFAFQVMAGVAFAVSDSFDILGTVRYRDFGDAEVEASLFKADFEIENNATLLEIGVRYQF